MILRALLRFLEQRLAELRPDAIFGINPLASAPACRQRYRAPVWADLNGYVLAEGQTHCHLQDSDEHLEHFWSMEKDVVRRADRISTVSRIQAHATLGELAILGRLNRHTHAYPFTCYVPNAVSERYREFTAPPRQFRGLKVPKDAFILLWSGGFNTWTDVDTLHAALERAMAERADLHFIATGRRDRRA